MSMRHLLVAVVAAVVWPVGSPAAAPQAGAPGGVTVAAEGKSDYAIVVRAKASPSEQRGAKELQTFIAAMTTAKLPIVDESAGPAPERAILVGFTEAARKAAPDVDPAKLGPEGYVLRTAGPRVLVLGSDVRGAMYGCTALLEKLGVRFYAPKVTATPATLRLVVPALNETAGPAFEYREVFNFEAWDTDWAARLRLNGTHHRLDEKTGGKVRYHRHFVHTFDELVPRGEFMAHPEYFPLIKGARQNAYVQRCLTNPNVLKLSIAKVLAWIKADPGALIFSVSQNDTDKWCECDVCKAEEAKYGSHSGLYLWFVNEVAAAVEKEHPDKLIDTLAYQFTEPPPRPGTIVPRKNVRVRLCPIANCEAHPYRECGAVPTKKFMDNLAGWAKLTDTLYIWHYTTNFANYLMPFPDFYEFPADIRLYKENGVKGIFFQGAYGSGGGGSFAELQAYVMAHLLWDPAAAERPLIEEWHKGVYGKAAPAMLEWFDLLHSKVKDPAAHFFIYQSPKKVPYLTADVVARGDELFDKAAALAAGDSTAQAYVAKARLGLRYTKLMQNPTTGPEFQAFIADVKATGITQLREGASIDGWVKEYERVNRPQK